jgi:hypothetical protein
VLWQLCRRRRTPQMAQQQVLWLFLTGRQIKDGAFSVTDRREERIGLLVRLLTVHRREASPRRRSQTLWEKPLISSR